MYGRRLIEAIGYVERHPDHDDRITYVHILDSGMDWGWFPATDLGHAAIWWNQTAGDVGPMTVCWEDRGIDLGIRKPSTYS